MKSCRTLVGILVSSLALLYSSSTLAFQIVSFDGKFTRFGSQEISYMVDARGSDDFTNSCDGKGPCVGEEEIIRTSFDSWSGVNGSDLVFVDLPSVEIKEPGYDKINSIQWVEAGWKGLSFSPPSSALAVTISTYKTSNNEIVDSDIFFNGEYFTWGSIDSPEEEKANIVDVQNIATHEIGHFIGLDHSSENLFEPVAKLYLATMFFASGPGEVFRRHLADDDQAAAQNLYSLHDPGEPVIDEISPNTIDIQSTGAATVRIVGHNFLDQTTTMIATQGGRGDVVGRVVSMSANEMNVVFDLYGLPSGQYDVVVANTYDRMARAKAGLQLGGGIGTIDDNTSDFGGGGSGALGGSSGGCRIDAQQSAEVPLSLLIGLLLPLVLIGIARLNLDDPKQPATKQK